LPVIPFGEITMCQNWFTFAWNDPAQDKTTLVDAIFRRSGLFRTNQEIDKRLMDTMALERDCGD
jgi:predicted membrane GTPase involved in stress response